MLTNIVLLVDLADYAPSDRPILGGYNSLELERQLRAQIQALPLGAHIKFIVHNYYPFPDAWDFLRADLKIQVEGSDPWILRDWYELFAGRLLAA